MQAPIRIQVTLVHKKGNKKVVCFENSLKNGCASDFIPPIPYVASFETYFSDGKTDEVHFGESVGINLTRIPAELITGKKLELKCVL